MIKGKATFHLEVSGNKVLIFFPSKFKEPLKSIDGPQVQNRWLKETNKLKVLSGTSDIR
jgi:hypothetical protein